MPEETRRHPDLFTPEEAAAYLHLPSEESLKTLREKKFLVGYEGYARHLMYWREDLDNCALKMAGRGHMVKERGPKLARQA
jgi:hypothetical protein